MLADQPMPLFKKPNSARMKFFVLTRRLKCRALFLLFFGIFFLSVTDARAITLDKTTYTLDSNGLVPIITGPEPGGAIVLYNTDTNAILFVFSNYEANWNLNYFGISPGHYSVIDIGTSWPQSCDGVDPQLTYLQCKAIDGFLNEAVFTVSPYIPSGGGGSEPSLGSAGIVSYRPEVEIASPKDGSLFSSAIPITYKAIDKNDAMVGSAQKEFGLIELPVSIFYSDKIGEWDYSLIASENKILIEKNLPAFGTYLWKWKNLLEGKFYSIIVDAIDRVGDIGEMVSGFFSIDLTPPTFIVTADPSVAKNENVTITIESSKDLVSLPEVFARQRGALPVKIAVSGSGRVYTGVYSAVAGFDGTAQVEVFGFDFAGNKGNTITGGGTFNVGVNPPGKPVIISPADREKIVSETIDIKGTAREDVEIIATVNGIDVYQTSVDSNGEFLIKSARLKKNAVNGNNIINIIAKDRVGAMSEAAILRISFNLAPTVALIKPEANATLAATTTIAIQAADGNNDKLRFRYEMAQAGLPAGQAGVALPEESDWQIISDTPSDKINFDTTEFGDGAYFLRVAADDGATTTVSTAIKIRLKNELPFIRFDDGRKTAVSGKSVMVRGTVSSPENLSPRPVITRLEYSMTGGKKWTAISALNGLFSSSEERFAAPFQDLKDGENEIIWRATDSRGFVGKAKHPIIVDTKPPEQPKILFPEKDAILAEVNNETNGRGKFNFTLRGTSEPRSAVYAEVDGKKFTGKAAFDGSFQIAGVALPSHGNYIVKTYAVDEALNKSAIVLHGVVYDNPLKLAFTSPRDGRGVGEKAIFSWLASDLDGDSIVNSVLSYRRIGQPFVTLAQNLKENKFEWNTAKLPEGNDYELKFEASDGLATSTLRAPFSIDHSLPRLTEFVIKSSNLVTELPSEISQSQYGKGRIFEATGRAEDGGSGVEFVEYRFEMTDAAGSQDSFKTPWYKGNINGGFLGKNTSFSIKSKLSLGDGKYLVVARARDAAGNVSLEKFQTIIVDATPPRAGSFEIMSQGIKLLPESGAWKAVVGTKFALNLSLESDTKNASVKMDNERIMLVKDLATGIWKGEFALGKIGTSTLLVSATDAVGNELNEQSLAIFQAAGRGKITYRDENGLEKPLAGATVNVLRASSGWSFLSLFRSTLVTSAISDGIGEYAVLAPGGSYKIAVEKAGFSTVKTDTVIFNSPTFITEDIVLKKNRAITILDLWNLLLQMLR